MPVLVRFRLLRLVASSLLVLAILQLSLLPCPALAHGVPELKSATANWHRPPPRRLLPLRLSFPAGWVLPCEPPEEVRELE
jgi:hypothetical protein